MKSRVLHLTFAIRSFKLSEEQVYICEFGINPNSWLTRYEWISLQVSLLIGRIVSHYSYYLIQLG